MYTIKQAALRSGISVELVRAWERRYGVVHPARTDSGYRLFDDAAVEALSGMRRLVEAGWSAREAAHEILTRRGVRAEPPKPIATVIAAGEPYEHPIPAGAESAAFASRFVAAAGALDAATMDAVLDEAFSLSAFERVAESVILPAMVQIGAEWAAGRLDVSAEHSASNAVMRRLGAAFEATGHHAGADRVLVGMAPGERHEIGALTFAVALSRTGLDVVYLGADVPAASWREAVAQAAPRGVVVGWIAGNESDGLRHALEVLMEADPGLVVAVGGRVPPTVLLEGSVIRLPERLGPSVAAFREALDTANLAAR